METLAYEAGMPPISTRAFVPKLVAQGYNAKEATKLTKARVSFPHVQQKLWPTSRPDGIVGQHYNLTQIPFDVQVNMHTHLALNYHILLHFKKYVESITQQQAMFKILFCFHKMNIGIGNSIIEPVAILCHGNKNANIWSGMVQVHLQNSETDGKILLQGTRVFLLLLDNETLTIAKVAKFFDPIASSNVLSIKVNTTTIKNVEAHHLFKQELQESFYRGFQYEFT